MKKLLCALLTLIMVLSLAACGGNKADAGSSGGSNDAGNTGGETKEPADTGSVADDPKVTLVYAEVNPLDTIVGQTASEFKRLVEEKSGGSITIDVRDSGVLGSENDMLPVKRTEKKYKDF